MIHLQMLGAFVLEHPLAILFCVIAHRAIGTVWYGPLFSKSWTAMNGITPAMMASKSKEEVKKGMMHGMAMSVITGFIISVVLGRTIEILDRSSPAYPLIIATIIWLPFTALPFAQNYAYLQKPFKLLLIDTGYMLVSMWAISLILFKAVV